MVTEHHKVSKNDFTMCIYETILASSSSKHKKLYGKSDFNHKSIEFVVEKNQHRYSCESLSEAIDKYNEL